jgi:perosamine synthetase
MADTNLTESEINAAIKVLRSGQLRQGPESDMFEKEFAKKVGAKHAATSANGSTSLHLAYMTFLKPGDEVLVPSFTFIATASMVAMAGGRPVFCDVDPETFLIDLKDAGRKVTDKTRAISPVHLFGNPCDADEVGAFAQKHNLTVVWDAAQAHGATFKGMDVGSFGDFVSYSFYPTKNLFVGEGGMTCCGDPERDNMMRHLRSHGQTGKYIHTMLGHNFRMTDVEAAVGREQLNRLDSMLLARRRNAGILNSAFSGIPGVTPQKTTPGGVNAWHQYCALIDGAKLGIDRGTLMARLKDKGIVTGVHYPRGLHQQPVFERMYGKMSLPVTESLTERIMALPVHHGMSVEDAERIVSAVKESFA